MLCASDFTITMNDRHALRGDSTQSRLNQLAWTVARIAAASVTIALLIAHGPLSQAQAAAPLGTMSAGANQNGATVNPSVPVCAVGPTVEGVDVTVFQGTIDWNLVKASGRSFAYARVSDGGFLDSRFDTYYAAIKAAGMLRGAYQFFEPRQDPTVQANIMINKVGTLGPGDLPAQLDVEITGTPPVSPAALAAEIQTWVTHVKAATGRTPVIYTSAGFWDSSVMSSAFGSDPLWVANYGVTCPTLPTGWTNWAFWQYTGSGTVAGIPVAVDLDKFNGSLTALQVFAGETVVTLTASKNPAIFRQSVTFTATVVGPSGIPSNADTVTFMDGAKVMSTPVGLNSGQAILRTNQFAVGEHTITAVFSGDATFPMTTSPPLIFYRSPKPH